jgi:hypothetical protein
VLAALLLALPSATLPAAAPRADATAVEEKCTYAFERNRQLWLHASQVPRYQYYRELEPGDGTRRASMMVRIRLEEASIQELTFEVVTRIADGTSALRVATARTIDGERAGLDLSEPERVALAARRGAGEEPLRLPLVGGERTERAGWLYETTAFAPDVSGAVALVDARELELVGPGRGWQPVLDDADREALRFFLWHHAPGGRAALEASARRRAAEAAREASGGAERDD